MSGKCPISGVSGIGWCSWPHWKTHTYGLLFVGAPTGGAPSGHVQRHKFINYPLESVIWLLTFLPASALPPRRSNGNDRTLLYYLCAMTSYHHTLTSNRTTQHFLQINFYSDLNITTYCFYKYYGHCTKCTVRGFNNVRNTVNTEWNGSFFQNC